MGNSGVEAESGGAGVCKFDALPPPLPLFFRTECARDRKERRLANERTEQYRKVRESGRSVNGYIREKSAHVSVRPAKGQRWR